MKSNPNQKIIKNKKAKRARRKKRAYYSLITILLLVCIIHSFRSAFLNVQNYFSLNHKISQLEQIQQKAKESNKVLKAQINEFKSLKGVETVARNELKMAGKNEVLVIIKENN